MLNGEVNPQNCRYSADENPQWMGEVHSQHPEKVNVWEMILSDRVVGTIFFAETQWNELFRILTGRINSEFRSSIP